MAQTLKFGNGTWATKKGSTLAYNDLGGNFKPLPFTYTGAGKGTRVNKEGLIEVVENDRPRIDYKDSEDGVFLLEKASTNLIPYSEDFSQSAWIKTRSSISSNSSISPDGTLNADKLIEDTSTNTHSTQNNVTIGNVDTTISVFVKADTRSRIRFILTDLTTGDYRIDLNLNNLSVIENNGGSRGSWTNTSYKIENFTNNWYKVSLTATKGAGSQASLSINLLDNSGNHTYTGDGTSGIYIWGAQLEEGSYPTSYIPNYGTAAGVTRSAETANGSGDASTFNDSEGVLMAEFKSLDSSDTSSRRLGITKNGTYEGLRIYMDNGTIGVVVFDGAANQYSKSINIDNSIFHKVALKYKQNDFSFFVDGFEYNPQLFGNTFVSGTLNDISFDYVGGNKFYSSTKQIQYFDSALNDSDLETLTSWVSFTDMAEGQLYTIE
jgi:hypothetical protein